MTQPSVPTGPSGPTSAPGEAIDPSGRRRLERAPGERLTDRARDQAQAPISDAGPTKAIMFGAAGAGIGIASYVVMAIGLSFTAGLLVVAVFTGRMIGLLTRAGADGRVSSAARSAIAGTIFLVALSLALGATWLWSHAEGGDLAIGDYLDQAYGLPLIGLEFVLGALVTWRSAR